MAQFNKIGPYKAQLRSETTLTINIENFLTNREEFEGSLMSEYGELNFAAKYLRDGFKFNFSLGENLLSVQHLFQDIKNPVNSQEITVNYNGNEHRSTITKGDIERLIKNKELGPFEGLLRIIKQSSDVKEFSESLKNLQNVLNTTNVANLVATVAEDADEPITVFKTLWECILQGLAYIGAIIGLAICATIIFCIWAMIGLAAAAISLARCIEGLLGSK
ncbi:MAG: hypothetical protein QME58_12535 [Bacteroidota bacterium]|nr:hypothetical protein [Bacteroidota bacterium]